MAFVSSKIPHLKVHSVSHSSPTFVKEVADNSTFEGGVSGWIISEKNKKNIQTNPINKDTKGAIESARIKWG